MPRWNSVPSFRPTRRAGIKKTGKRSKRDERDLPTQDEHRADHDGHQDHVAHHVREQVGEGLLRADHVVVESTDQGAGLRAREEGDRHLLHVAEHLGAQVVDQTLADHRRRSAFEEREERVEEREPGAQRRQPDGQRRSLVLDGDVDDGAEQQRRDRTHDGVEHDRDEEDDQQRAVLPARR